MSANFPFASFPITRREWLRQSSNGFGMLALSALMAEEARGAHSPKAIGPHFPPKAKSVIMCFMDGGPSHVDTFDPKPLLKKRQGEKIGQSAVSTKSQSTPDRVWLGRGPYFTQPIDQTLAEPLEGTAGATVFMHSMTPHASVTNTLNRPRRTLILSYRAADAYPIYAGEITVKSDAHVRLVRGERLRIARFSMREFPVPKQRRTTTSLFELQELSRKEGNARS